MSVVISYLEMLDSGQLRSAKAAPQLELRRMGESCAALNRFFYREVGRAWAWTDRLAWTDEQWRSWVERERLSTWIGWVRGNPIGYAELEEQAGDTELAYFGLLPQFLGRGFGAAMLSHVVAAAWDLGSTRVWLHTCTLDHPRALANYERCGFRCFKEQRVAAGDPVGSD